MRIVGIPRRFVSHDWGGTETVVLQTGKRLRNRGHEFSIYTPQVFSDQSSEQLQGVPIRRFPYFYPVLGLSPEARLQLDKKGGNLFSTALMRALRREPQLDLIHLHTLKRLGGIGRREALRRGIPYVVSLHGGVFDVPQQEQQELTAPLNRTLEWGKVIGLWLGSNRVLEDADAILCVGQAEEEKIRARYPHKRVRWLPNGVDCAEFEHGNGTAFRRAHGIPDSAKLLLQVSRIDPQKNQLAAVRLLADLQQGSNDVRLVLIGHVTNEAYREQLERTIDQFALRERVTLIPGFPPGSSKLVDAYHACDVFVLPTAHEPFGIVILEAWAAGKPVVASRIGGIPSFVDHEQDALLCEPGDARDLHRATRRLLEEPELGRDLAQRGRTKARDRFDWNRVTDQLLDIYAEVRGETLVRQ